MFDKLFSRLERLTCGLGVKIRKLSWLIGALLAVSAVLYASISVFLEYRLWRGLLYFLPRLSVGLVIAFLVFILLNGFGKIVEASERQISAASTPVGAKLPDAPLSPPEIVMPGDGSAASYQGADAIACAVCGAGNRPMAKFCVVCGANMSGTSETESAPMPDFLPGEDNEDD